MSRHLVEVPDSFAIARWPRDADVATIARCILGTLKYEPHTADITVLRQALEGVIEHTARGGTTRTQQETLSMKRTQGQSVEIRPQRTSPMASSTPSPKARSSSYGTSSRSARDDCYRSRARPFRFHGSHRLRSVEPPRSEASIISVFRPKPPASWQRIVTLHRQARALGRVPRGRRRWTAS